MFQRFILVINLDIRIGFWMFLGFFFWVTHLDSYNNTSGFDMFCTTLQNYYGIFFYISDWVRSFLVWVQFRLWITDFMPKPTLNKDKIQLYKIFIKTLSSALKAGVKILYHLNELNTEEWFRLILLVVTTLDYGVMVDWWTFMIHHVSEYHFILMLKLLLRCQLSNAQEELLLHNETSEAIHQWWEDTSITTYF